MGLGGGGGSSYGPPQQQQPSYGAPNINTNNNQAEVVSINNQGPFTNNRDPDVIVGDPRAVDPGGHLDRFKYNSNMLASYTSITLPYLPASII